MNRGSAAFISFRLHNRPPGLEPDDEEDERAHAFRDDGVLQENVIFRAIKSASQNPTVFVSQSDSPDDPNIVGREVPFNRVVRSSDPERFIHLVPDELGHALAVDMESRPCTLSDLKLNVSTGRVVDFRARALLRDDPDVGTLPLIYPGHFNEGRIEWPKLGGKLTSVPRHHGAAQRVR